MDSRLAAKVCLTFDVEERFHSHLTPDDAARNWRLRDRLTSIVDWLQAEGKRATFFVVGELAQAYPDVVRRMTRAGSEVASHSFSHLWVRRENAKLCCDDITRSKNVLEDVTGEPVYGFRAPSWSASVRDDWLWEHLASLGFRYDSSLFPVATSMYGSRDNPVDPHWVCPELLEIPPSVHCLGALRIPYGGSFYFRFYPLAATRWLIGRSVLGRRTPVLYFHPWDFEPADRVLEDTVGRRFVGNVGVRSAWAKFQRLLGEAKAQTMLDRYHELLAAPQSLSPCMARG